MKFDRETQITKSLAAIDKGISFREADKLFGIPYSTISKRYRGVSWSSYTN
jgi:hypothetical protein